MKEILDEALREAPTVEHVVWLDRCGSTSQARPRPRLGQARHARAGPRSTRRRRTCSPTRRGRPAGRRAPSTSRAASSSRSRGRSPTRPTSTRATPSTSPPTWAGSWGRGRSSAAGAVGARVVFAEGAPDWPDDRLWRLVEEERVDLLGLSPTLVRALIPKGDPVADVSSLTRVRDDRRAVEPGSVPLAARRRRRRSRPDREPQRRHRGRRVLPLGRRDGADQGVLARLPGARRGHGRARRRGPPVRGEVGELVCRRPWPGMTRGVWGDPERYLETYWRRFPGVWTHGDWASVDEDGYWYLHGRSDDTLNIAGKRIGPAELESAALGHAGGGGGGDRRPARRQGRGGVDLLRRRSRARRPATSSRARSARRCRTRSARRFKPDRILFVPALPKTRSAKIVRRAVRAQALGTDPGRPLVAREPGGAGGDRARRGPQRPSRRRAASGAGRAERGSARRPRPKTRDCP